MWAYATSKTVKGGRTSPAAFARPPVCSAKAFTLKRGIEAKLNATTVQQSLRHLWIWRRSPAGAVPVLDYCYDRNELHLNALHNYSLYS